MAEATYDVSAALSNISSNLSTINNNVLSGVRDIEGVRSVVGTIDGNLKAVSSEVDKLAREFHAYVKIAENQHNVSVAETRLVKIRQELETKYGFHADTRRTTIGILQADDLELIRKDTIATATEELMLSAPGYWLAPCLVALAAWINDKPEIADRAIREAIKRNDEKTSILFALICRRADRKSASLKWTQRYLANQDEENLDRKCVIILDAFASGLLGSDSEGVVAKQLEEWMRRLSDKAGFVERQTKQWSEAINLKRKPFNSGYTYLRKYSKTWPKLQYIMEGAFLHGTIFRYFDNIFKQQSSGAALKEQLDEILMSLCSEYDDEELPLRRDEKLNKFVIDYDGDMARAQKSMKVEQTAFDAHKDFTQLLTDSAMKPESSHASVSTQKFAIALSRDWISNAYNDVVAKNRMAIPDTIEINVDNFNDRTRDGRNENELVQQFEQMVDKEKEAALAENVLTGFQKFALIGGIIIGAIGIAACIAGQVFLGLIAIVAGAGLIINHFSSKKAVENRRNGIEQQFSEKRESGVQIIRATLAEVVDFRSQFAEKDKESSKVVDFLDQIKPEQYVRKLSETTRRIKTAG
ncbi:MAG: hypothetical protein LBT59_22475 [Clostridiales bacterium]|jgi:hypothetical protein|nr:hypothetical protein [Clostridiales bacterium]